MVGLKGKVSQLGNIAVLGNPHSAKAFPIYLTLRVDTEFFIEETIVVCSEESLNLTTSQSRLKLGFARG